MQDLMHLVDNTIPGQTGADFMRYLREDRRQNLKTGLDARVVRDLNLDRRSS